MASTPSDTAATQFRLAMLLLSQIALWLAAAHPAQAQQSGSDGHDLPQQLDAVVVTATGRPDDPLRVPAAIDVIDARTLSRAQPQLQLSEALPRIPGVVARDRQNQAQDLQLSIRGFGSRATFGVRGVRLYTDGIPATMPDGQGQVSHFGLESAGRIEVLRGPYSALYGNASGGVVSLFTAAAPETPTLRVGGVAGSDELARASLAWQSRFGANRDGELLFDAARVEDGGYRDHSASRRESGQFLLRGGFGDGGRYLALFNTLDLRADDPQGLTAEQLRADRRAASAGALAFDTRKTVRQSQAGAQVELPLAQAHRLGVTAWRGQRDTFQILSVPVFAQVSPLSGGGVIDLARDYAGADARWTGETEFAGGPLALTLGLQYETSEERRRGYENFVGDALGVVGRLRRDEDNRVAGRDLYAQLDWQPHPRWRVNLGARRSKVEFRTRDHFVAGANPDDSGRLRYARTSPVAGALFRATPWLSLFANAGAGFETPTFSELAYRDDGASGLNDALAPARSRNLEAGLRARRDDWRASVTLFRTRTRDELVVASSSGGRSVFANAGPTRRRGVELAYAVELAPRWHLDASATWIDATVLETGLHIPGIARRSGFVELRWSPRDDLDLSLDARGASRIHADDANTAAAPGHARLDLGAERRWRFGSATLRGYARIENLLDRDIVGSVIVNEANGRWFEPAPGRQWVLGFSVESAFGAQ
jgi:iron complex outermembrane receptor protein